MIMNGLKVMSEYMLWMKGNQIKTRYEDIEIIDLEDDANESN